MNHIFPVDEKKVWIQSNKRFDVRKLCTQFCVVSEKHFENNLSISSWIVTSLWFVSSGLPFFFPPLSSFAEDQIARGFLMLFSEKFWWPHLPKPTETHYLPPSPEHFHGFDKKNKKKQKKNSASFSQVEWIGENPVFVAKLVLFCAFLTLWLARQRKTIVFPVFNFIYMSAFTEKTLS